MFFYPLICVVVENHAAMSEEIGVAMGNPFCGQPRDGLTDLAWDTVETENQCRAYLGMLELTSGKPQRKIDFPSFEGIVV